MIVDKTPVDARSKIITGSARLSMHVICGICYVTPICFLNKMMVPSSYRRKNDGAKELSTKVKDAKIFKLSRENKTLITKSPLMGKAYP
jgi:hypothetical protein